MSRVQLVINCVILGLVIGACVGFGCCTAPVNVNVKAENWQCQTKIENHDGSIDFQGCQKTDGQAPVDQDATDGQDELKVSSFQPSEN